MKRIITKKEISEAVKQGWMASLELSIKKYERWAKCSIKEVKNRYKKDEINCLSCPLCVKAGETRAREKDCNLCPIKRKTLWNFCSRTPFTDICTAIFDDKDKEIMPAIQSEIKFLKSIRPIAKKMDKDAE